MIYVSSSCSKQRRIGTAIQELADHGFRNIELTGGTKYYEGYEDDIIELKTKYDLSLLLHNYFPPPKEDFVINLASLDDKVFEKSLEHLRNAIKFADALGVSKLGFHAGFYLDIKVDEIGKAISLHRMWDRNQSYQRFCDAFNLIKNESEGIQIYIENNVYSRKNFKEYGLPNPFMLTSAFDYRDMKQDIDFKLLLDIAHLYVSAHTLGFDFGENLDQMITETDYIHLSDNDGFHDQNKGFCFKNKLLDEVRIRKACFVDKTITLEVYTGIDNLKESLKMVTEIINE